MQTILFSDQAVAMAKNLQNLGDILEPNISLYNFFITEAKARAKNAKSDEAYVIEVRQLNKIWGLVASKYKWVQADLFKRLFEADMNKALAKEGIKKEFKI